MKTFDISHKKSYIDYNLSTIKGSIEYLSKLRRCIDSCETLQQLNTLRKFIQNYFYCMCDVGFQGFVAIEYMDLWERKYNEITKTSR